MEQAALHDLQRVGYACSGNWCFYWVSSIWALDSNEDCGMSLNDLVKIHSFMLINFFSSVLGVMIFS